MKIDELKSKYSDRFEQLASIIKASASELFKRAFEIGSEVADGQDIKKLLSNEKLPRVHVSFISEGENQLQHCLSLDPDFVLKLYAWMIGDELGSLVVDEHLEGIQEGINQIIGQIQTSLNGEKGSLSIDKLKVKLIGSQEEGSAELPEEGGICVNCTVVAGEDRFIVQHYLWSIGDGEAIINAGSDAPFTSDEDLVGVHPVEFGAFTSKNREQPHSQNIDMLMDVELDVLVELGRKTMLVKDVLKLGNGSIVELDKAAGEPLEVFINGRKFAEGEVVVVDDHFGVRITHLSGPKDKVLRSR